MWTLWNYRHSLLYATLATLAMLATLATLATPAILCPLHLLQCSHYIFRTSVVLVSYIYVFEKVQ